jgi:hypothetical protein
LFDVLIDDGLRRKAKAEFPATDEDTADVKLMTRMALGECKLTERPHCELTRHEGITKVSLERYQTSALPPIVQPSITEYDGHVLDFDMIARVVIVIHESRHPNPRLPHLVSEVFSALSQAA